MAKKKIKPVDLKPIKGNEDKVKPVDLKPIKKDEAKEIQESDKHKLDEETN